MRTTIPFLLVLAACGETAVEEAQTVDPKPPEEAVTVDRARLKVFGELPETMPSESNPITPEKVALGRMLYYEPRLSASGEISCNSCHMLDQYGVDGDATSEGHEAQRGDRNSPTVYHAAGHVAQFWDGRAADVEEQAKGPVLNPIEMAMTDEAQVEGVLRSIPGYAEPFAKAFPDAEQPITYDHMAKAIGAFERKLVTPSPFDAYLAGDDDALTDEQEQGLVAFLDAGCTTCHSGAYLGGHMYQKAGLVKPWPNQEDPGRFKVTGNESDKMVFKVPSLRNVEKTAPYFHDGSASDLGEAVRMMGTHQLGKDLSDEQVASIVAFLGSLTGELPKEYIAKPELPK